WYVVAAPVTLAGEAAAVAGHDVAPCRMQGRRASPHAKMADKGEVRHIQTWLIRLYPLYADISSWTPLIWYRRYRGDVRGLTPPITACRSEEHTPELQSRENLVCRLLLEKKNKNT